MSARLTTLPKSASHEEMFAVMRRDGGVIIKDFLSPEDVVEMNEGSYPLFEKLQPTKVGGDSLKEMGPDFHASNTTHLRGLLGLMPVQVSKILLDPVYDAIMHETLKFTAETYIGDHLNVTNTSWILSLALGFRVAPGAGHQVLHRDQSIHSVIAKENSHYTIAGTKSTEKNGATRVIPGSHLWAPTRIPKPEESVPAEMEPGSAMFWLGSVYHGAGANTCTEDDPNKLRILYGVFACQDYLRAEECQQLVVPEAVAKTLPLAVLKKAGWAKGAGGSGFVNALHPYISLGVTD
ncbi:hypothetical protein RQP46_000034 [Phenoliferia psychrophenolica]